MFLYTLSGKAIENGQNRMTVDYSDGTVKCNETFFFSSKEDLDSRITNKIESLDKAVLLDSSIDTASYVKTDKVVVVVAPNDVQIAEQKLYECKRLIDLGVMSETDQEYVDAVAEYKVAVTVR